jgi:2'-5' RNA ligase
MKDLYFIAIIPPADVAAEADNLRHRMWQQYGSSHSLNSPPHITLAPTFSLRGKNEESLKRGLEKIGEAYRPFPVRLDKVGHFGQKSIFLKVEENQELRDMHTAIKKCLRQEDITDEAEGERAYHPHLTLATRDLKKEKFKTAWGELQNLDFHEEFHVQEICLLQHSGKRWLIVQHFSLRK